MSALLLVQQITDRVNRLLLRQEELLKERHLLLDQIDALKLERQQLQNRLQNAKQHIEYIVSHLPEEAEEADEANDSNEKPSNEESNTP